MPKASKYVSPKNGGLGEEIRELCADLTTRITGRLSASNAANVVNFKAFLNAIIADLDAYTATIPVIGTVAVSTDNVVTAAEKASAVPVAISGLTQVKAGDFLKVEIFDSTGKLFFSTTGGAMTAGATTATINVTLTTAAVGSYACIVTLNRAGVGAVAKSQSFTVTP